MANSWPHTLVDSGHTPATVSMQRGAGRKGGQNRVGKKNRVVMVMTQEQGVSFTMQYDMCIPMCTLPIFLCASQLGTQVCDSELSFHC